MLALLIAVVVAALVFDFINGFHDAANAIATSVSTGVLPLRTAVLIAASCNFCGALLGTAVAQTIALDFTDPSLISQQMMLAVLLGASAWNIITWWFGMPSSSSHALIGALAGAVVLHAGWNAFHWYNLYRKVLIPLVASPLMGFVIAFVLMISILWVVRHLTVAKVNRYSRRMQLVSACAMAISHGSNDAQKVMGIVTLTLAAYVVAPGSPGLPSGIAPTWNGTTCQVPLWVILACATSIAAGTAAGGRRIIKTMGSKIIKIVPLQGFAAETSGAVTIIAASHLGVPVSTTHCINACIMGVGASRRLSAVRWGVAGNMVVAWIIPLPASALLAAVILWVFRLVGFTSD